MIVGGRGMMEQEPLLAKKNGCPARILSHNNKAYTECFSIRLNIVIGKYYYST